MRCLLGGSPHIPHPEWDARLAAHARGGGKPERRSSPSLSGYVALPDPPGAARAPLNVDVGDELLTVPSPGHERPLVVAIPRCYTFGAEEMPAVRDSACSPPLWPSKAGPNLLMGHLVPAEVPRPEPRAGETLEPHGARLAARLGLGDAAAPSRPLAPASSTDTRRTRCLGRCWWSLASEGRTSRRSSGSVTTSSTPGRTCRPQRSWDGGLLPHPGHQRSGSGERSATGRVWDGAGGGAAVALPAPKRACVAVGPTGEGLQPPCNKIRKDGCSHGCAPCPFRRRTLCEAALDGRRVGAPKLQCVFSA